MDVLQLNTIPAARYGIGLGHKFIFPQHMTAAEIGRLVREFLAFTGMSEKYYTMVATGIYRKWKLRKAPYYAYLAAVQGEKSLDPSVGSSRELVTVEKEKAREEADDVDGGEETGEDWTFVHRSKDEAESLLSDCIMVRQHDSDSEIRDGGFRDEEISKEDVSLWTGPGSSLSSNARLWPWPPEFTSNELTVPDSPSPVPHQKEAKRRRLDTYHLFESEVRTLRSTQELESESDESPLVSKYWAGVIPLRSSLSVSMSHQNPSTPATSSKECTIIDLTKDEEDYDVREEVLHTNLRELESEWAFVENEDSLTEASFETALED